MKSGQRIDGTVKAITGEEVLLEVAGQPLKFPLANVSAIYFAAPPKSTVANPLNDALRVLKGLQSAVYGGVTYDDFAPRVTDAKSQIDQMLSDAPDSPAKKSLAEALGFYVYASSAWNAHITHGRDVAQCKALERNPLFYKCEVLKRTTLTAMILWGVEPLFECASERVATAERLIDNAIKRGEEWGNESPNPTPSEFAKLAMKLRQQEMAQIPPLTEPTTPNGAIQRYPWKMNIVTTVFWDGEESGNGKMSHQRESAWDANWMANYGGYDNPDPSARRDYIPVAYIPKQNPFYCALPYNDVTKDQFKPEAQLVIPWFKQSYTGPGQSVCRHRWIAIRKGNRAAKTQRCTRRGPKRFSGYP